MTEPIRDGTSKGSYILREELNKMLDDYYAARGWNKDGIPTRAKLEELELKDIADDMKLE
jgi:aldehyde:ferredoxin oxidoreductase